MQKDESEDDLAAAAVTHVSQLDPGYRARFAKRVAQTLEIVFKVDRTKAQEKVRLYFEDVEIPPSLFTYHLSPLQIAADLASVRGRPLSESELRRYRQLADVSETTDGPEPTGSIAYAG